MTKLKAWWHGSGGPSIAKVGDRRIIISADVRYHWTARIVRQIATFYLVHWKWILAPALLIPAFTKLFSLL